MPESQEIKAQPDIKNEFRYCAFGVFNRATVTCGTGAVVLAYWGYKDFPVYGVNDLHWFMFSAVAAVAGIYSAAWHIEDRYRDYHQRLRTARKLVPMITAIISIAIVSAA